VAARLATSVGVTTVITRASNPGNIRQIVRYIQAQRNSPALSPQSNGHHETEESGAPLSRSSSDSRLGPLSRSGSELKLGPLSRSGSELRLDELENPPLHTRFIPSGHRLRDRRFWVLHGLAPRGTIYIDAGAHKALVSKAGLLPVGVIDLEGDFGQHEAVRLVAVERRDTPDADGKMWSGHKVEIGRALVNYSSKEIMRIKGHHTSHIKKLLGYCDSDYVAPRYYISLHTAESRPVSPAGENELGIIV
jgi:glutamate 5-kinase